MGFLEMGDFRKLFLEMGDFRSGGFVRHEKWAFLKWGILGVRHEKWDFRSAS